MTKQENGCVQLTLTVKQEFKLNAVKAAYKQGGDMNLLDGIIKEITEIAEKKKSDDELLHDVYDFLLSDCSGSPDALLIITRLIDRLDMI